jgi:hypothetical protein
MDPIPSGRALVVQRRPARRCEDARVAAPITDFDEALAALMAWLGRPVRISAFAVHGPAQAQVLDAEGVLAAGWDPDVLRANGFEGSAILRLEEMPGFSLYLVREDFEELRDLGDHLTLRTGGLGVAIGPRFTPGPRS